MASQATPKKKVVKAKVGTAKPSHPKTADMVLEAVTNLNEKGGTSLQAIKKYLAEVHKIDIGRMGTFIIKAIKNLTTNGKLAQTKGHGASGSFKLAVTPKAAAPKKAKKVSPKKVTASKKSAKPKAAVKKSPAKAVTTTKKVAAKKPKASKPAPTTVETKKAKKPAVVKTQAPKVKLPKTLKAKTAPKPSTPKKSTPKNK